MEQLEWFQFSIEQALEMIIVFQASGKILYVNSTAAKLLKYKDGLCGRSIEEIYPQIAEKISQRNLPEKEEELEQFIAYRGNRTCFPVRGKVLRYSGMNPSEEIYFCIANDISTEIYLEKKIRHVEKEAEKAARVKSEFVANVTHELRTPVNGILGNTRELLSGEEETEKIKRLKMIERGCNDMNALINNILDFSKLEAGKFTLESRKFSFRNMIDYIKGNHSKQMTEKGLDFSITVSPEIPKCIIGDELRIVQILNNLISNACKFTSVGGVHVEVVKTAQAGKRAELFFMVIDSGIGIAKEDQDKLFKSFSQVDMSISRKYGGTGLGLNISKQLVELMGGDIHVESNVGKGTVFSFHIWIELPDDCELLQNAVEEQKAEKKEITDSHEQELMNKLHRIAENQLNTNIWKYGEKENKKEIDKKMSKLILSVVMENWEKAEMLAEAVKKLVEEAPREVKSAAFRMKMAVQKGDIQKATEAHEKLLKVMEESNGNSQ